MKKTILYKNFFAFSSKKKKAFFTHFDSKFNIIHGKNTSGKSTLIESILYTFGINDERRKLDEVLKEEVTFRLEFIIYNKNGGFDEFIVIRDDGIIFVKFNGEIKKFIGIDGNNSVEHKKLKEFWSEVFGFNLFLEMDGGYKKAPIEALFLPFYVAQDVGWVYRHKSFRGLDFIKNFKNDFFDYYLGIFNEVNRTKKMELEQKVRNLKNHVDFLSSIENNDVDAILYKTIDESNISYAKEYLEYYKDKLGELVKVEYDYLLKNNNLLLLENRKSVLNRIKRKLREQNPEDGFCPTCKQHLPNKIEDFYRHYQDENDTEAQLKEVKEIISKMKDTQGSINTLSKKMDDLQNDIFKYYGIWKKRESFDLNFDRWLNVKVGARLSNNIENKLKDTENELHESESELKKIDNTNLLGKQRSIKDHEFSCYFRDNLLKLNVKPFDDERYTMIYKIPAFPRQGVELLKTLLAYNFAFCKIIQKTSYVNDFPLLLDAIFKEDIDEDNRGQILSFIYQNTQSQIIFSMADSVNNKISANYYNEHFFELKAKMICIGGNTYERAFLHEDLNSHLNLMSDTLGIIHQ